MEQCIFCEVKFEIFFDDDSEVLAHCPCCGEKWNDPYEDIDMDPDGQFWDTE